jgi:hypothetical protein
MFNLLGASPASQSQGILAVVLLRPDVRPEDRSYLPSLVAAKTGLPPAQSSARPRAEAAAIKDVGDLHEQWGKPPRARASEARSCRRRRHKTEKTDRIRERARTRLNVQSGFGVGSAAEKRSYGPSRPDAVVAGTGGMFADPSYSRGSPVTI